MKSFKQYIEDVNENLGLPISPAMIPYLIPPSPIKQEDDYDDGNPFDQDFPWWEKNPYIDPIYLTPSEDEPSDDEPFNWEEILPWFTPKEDPNQGTPFKNPDGTWTV